MYIYHELPFVPGSYIYVSGVIKKSENSLRYGLYF